jgi:hypothetical protein
MPPGSFAILPHQEIPLMKTILAALALAVAGMTGSAYAANAACEKSADDKKLAGAARSAHVKKCEREAGGAAGASPMCEKSAADKKLAGAAKSSHLKKCMADEKAGTAPAAAAAPAKAATPAVPATPAAASAPKK